MSAEQPLARQSLFAALKKGLIVSCQVQADDPIFLEGLAAKMAAGAYWAGADIIALDCTGRLVNGRPAYALLADIRLEIPKAILFADIATYEEAQNAVALGADIVAPTLNGYTAATAQANAPDFPALEKMCRDFSHQAYVFMEGGINTPEEAAKALDLGAHAVVVGSAITRPHLIAKRFVQKILAQQGSSSI